MGDRSWRHISHSVLNGAPSLKQRRDEVNYGRKRNDELLVDSRTVGPGVNWEAVFDRQLFSCTVSDVRTWSPDVSWKIREAVYDTRTHGPGVTEHSS